MNAHRYIAPHIDSNRAATMQELRNRIGAIVYLGLYQLEWDKALGHTMYLPRVA